MNDSELAPRHSSTQLTLFPSTREAFVAETFISADEMESWHRKGWLSFDPLQVDRYDAPERVEVLFIKGLSRSGLSDAMINRILNSLERPYRYDPSETFFSFLENRWIGLPPEPDPADVTGHYLAELVKAEDWESLRELQCKISEALDAAENPDETEEE